MEEGQVPDTSIDSSGTPSELDPGGVELGGDLDLGAFPHVAVAVERDLRRRMPHERAHLLDVHACSHEEAGIGVTKVVEAQPDRKASSTDRFTPETAVEVVVAELAAALAHEQVSV